MTATCLMAVAGDLDDAQSAGPALISLRAAKVKSKELTVGVGGGINLQADDGGLGELRRCVKPATLVKLPKGQGRGALGRALTGFNAFKGGGLGDRHC